MAPDDEDSEDLYDDEFDFVDDDDDEVGDDEDDDSDLDDDDSELDSPVEDIAAEVNGAEGSADSEPKDKPAPRPAYAKRESRSLFDDEADGADRNEQRDGDPDEAGEREEPAEEYKRPELPANFRVHVYEYQEYKRTIDRPFTAEDAEAFASEFNRTSKSYGRFAVTGKEDVKPRKLLD